jgi:hypothetical protein
LVAIDCAITGTVLESERFGHEEGAGTGALALKSGRSRSRAGQTGESEMVDGRRLELPTSALRTRRSPN